MTCRECAEFLSDFLDGELDVEVLRVFERHLSLCPNCVTYLEQFRLTITAGRNAFGDVESTDADVPEDLIRAILEARRA